ncbi:uncharacterized protein Z518_11277 [Rhinocladiella mackenziei CBS 650.93]|uniref:Major facilitator superfamily (MFS) profile domain-containing protein n=1 Tax=Rhinocladiella mackenziei CBS 650.93 TaxID=1442369 RepID=A0A0D2I1F5_9EURO|nr:uncharacterized protein Z518_11277 [Rhinocladiella mackenziei CBS 650.93]KIW99538.1 hypothetical protein Z518_11277 [Rhinocladiella mackenziei CBS 650.93]
MGRPKSSNAGNAGNEANNEIEPVNAGRLPFWRMVWDQGGVTPEVATYPYAGSGTDSNPYVVQWIPNDPRDPMLFSKIAKWGITMEVAIATLAVALISSAYTGGIEEIMAQFHIGSEVATLGVSLFVLGFAVGPLLWAPMSELFGRQLLFIGTYAALTAFNAGAAGAQNSWTLLILRFFAGAFGSSPLTNAGGVIADMFPADERGLAMSLFAAAPFLGPVLGPIIGGFLGMNAGWRWVEGFLAIFSGALWIIGSLLVPETYAPVILRRRAEYLSKATGKVYLSKLDIDRGQVTLKEALGTALSRPWILLFREPIVLLLSVYMALIYGILYMLFAAFPIVYQQGRGWNSGIGGLAFLGIMVGMLFAVAYTIPDNKRYVKILSRHDGFASPEARLPPCLIGSVALPVGLFWFAWTNYPSIHWMVSIAAGVPFGFGMVLVFLSIMNYLIDSYTIFAASVLAASSVLRSCFGAAFPLFTTYMYDDLGIHWASTIPSFLALACVPFPFLFYKYGATIRARCKFAAESDAFMRKLQQQTEIAPEPDEARDEAEEKEAEEVPQLQTTDSGSSNNSELTVGDLRPPLRSNSMASTRTTGTLHRIRSEYQGNPYDIDRVNTRQSFRS